MKMRGENGEQEKEIKVFNLWISNKYCLLDEA